MGEGRDGSPSSPSGRAWRCCRTGRVDGPARGRPSTTSANDPRTATGVRCTPRADRRAEPRLRPRRSGRDHGVPVPTSGSTADAVAADVGHLVVPLVESADGSTTSGCPCPGTCGETDVIANRQRHLAPVCELVGDRSPDGHGPMTEHAAVGELLGSAVVDRRHVVETLRHAVRNGGTCGSLQAPVASMTARPATRRRRWRRRAPCRTDSMSVTPVRAAPARRPSAGTRPGGSLLEGGHAAVGVVAP